MNERKAFGFARTECACNECVLNCQHMPSYLIPEDLPTMAAALGYDDWEKFALENLAASPGATVMTSDGQVCQIQTLVPQRQANGACKFLTAENRCQVHAVSPFGCAFFSHAQSRAEADARSLSGLHAIAQDWVMHGMYARLWQLLNAHGICAVPPLEAQARIRAAWAAQAELTPPTSCALLPA
jgi:hypothetical protein